jgi:FAD binding domain/Berberine and berberine like
VNGELFDRRTVLGAGLGAGLAAVVGCAGSRALTAAAATPDWSELDRLVLGGIYRPGMTGYTAMYELFDPMYDSVHPAAVIRAASVNDVRQSVLFAGRNNLVCVPKSGGHSYVGASSVQDGMVIDVRALNGVSYKSGIAAIGAGAKLYDVHVALDQYGQSLPTGTCPTVGVAGLALGGGMGPDTRAFGLTSDRIAAMDVVLPDGRLVTASATDNPDLFWALRGAGGGNFGIVTQIRFRTIPARTVGTFSLQWPQSRAAAVVRGWQRFAREAPNTYWANLHLDAHSDGTIAVRAIGVSRTGSATAAAALLESMIGSRATYRSFAVRSHLAAVRYLGGGTTSPRTGFTSGSDVLRGPMDAATINSLIAVVVARARAGATASALLDPLGGLSASPTAGGSCWPWRSALGVIQWYVGLAAHPSSASYNSARQWITNGHHAVAGFSAGGYVNYVEPSRPVASYYGASWTRLQQVRATYDPTRFFHSAYGIT